MTNEAFIRCKRAFMRTQYHHLNDMQRQAVFMTEGPVLILAGAGSGKTTVLVNRIAFLLQYGNAYFSEFTPQLSAEQEARLHELAALSETSDEQIAEFKTLIRPFGVNPWNVLAITFTNKAANELKERLKRSIGPDADAIYAGTFHSICCRILRREISELGYTSSFTIYDTDDSVRLLKDVIKSVGENDKNFPPKQILNIISRSKDSMQTQEAFEKEAQGDYRRTVIAKIRKEYNRRLKESNALDFDDIILLTVQLFEQCPDVLEHYQHLFKYILVDEYQDTNVMQYRFISLLAKEHKNLCVVGDDDQSIYKFRGATIENILNFETQFPGAAVIRLEQNYRSTQNILNAANGIIAHNTERKGKTLWTANGVGEKIIRKETPDDLAEATYVVKTISDNVAKGARFSDHAVLYRTNAQSGPIERNLARAGIPYRIVGGLKFYDRKEVKDIISYLAVINNPADAIRLKRIINEPKRGIGDASIEKVEQMATQLSTTMFEVMKDANQYAALARRGGELRKFALLIEDLREYATYHPLGELFDYLMDETGYMNMLQVQGPEGQARIENLGELKNNMIQYENEHEDATLSSFLEEIALYTDLDKLNDDEDDYVVMMTLHSAKGLEFNNVFLVGMENGLFPSEFNMRDPEQLEEERRLAYVGVTRAKKQLYITNAQSRMVFGQTAYHAPSVFIEEIPKELMIGNDKSKPSFSASISKPKASRPVNRPTSSFRTLGMTPAKPQQTAASVIDYQVGDTVKHSAFGLGKVLSMTPMGNDTLVEVNFEKKGVKKIMAAFAKLSKVE